MKRLLRRLLSDQDQKQDNQDPVAATDSEDEDEDSDRTITLRTSDLCQQKLFKGVAPEVLLPYLRDCSVKVLKDGATLLRHDAANRTVYLILNGKCKVCLPPDLGNSIAKLKSGEIVGEMSFIDKGPTIASVVTEGTVRALCIPEKICHQLMRAEPDISLNMLQILTGRLRNNNELLAALKGTAALHLHNAQIDPLTSLHNRRWLDSKLPRLMQRYNRDHKPLSLMMLDIDHFKQFNDTHGHPAGDEALRTVAGVLVATLRPEDMVIRYGGEEMLAVLPNTDDAGAWPVAERAREAISNTAISLPGQEQTASVTVSIGLSTMQTGQSPKHFISSADGALYQAKEAGRNRTHH